MTINNTLNYVLASRAVILQSFSAQVTTGSTYLKGAGGEAVDGWPVPSDGRAVGIQCWDGLSLKSGTGEVQFSAGDRLSIYAAYSAGAFTVTLRVNGVGTTLAATGLVGNTTLTVSLHIILE